MRTHRQLRQCFGRLAGASTLLLVLCSLPESAIAQTQGQQKAIDAAKERARIREHFRTFDPSLTDAEIDALIAKARVLFQQRTPGRPKQPGPVDFKDDKYSPDESVVPSAPEHFDPLTSLTDAEIDALIAEARVLFQQRTPGRTSTSPEAPNTVPWKLLAGIAIGVVLIVTLWASRPSRS